MPRSSYPPISDYALIGDCHSAALVSRGGSIDWCCLPRFDSDSCFGRLLDWENGGYFEVAPRGRCRVRREYLESTLILVTTFTSGRSEARVIDFFAMRKGGRVHPRRELVRIIEGVKGRLEFAVRIVPRFDFGEVRPWIYRADPTAFVAAGGNTGLLISGDPAFQRDSAGHDLCAEATVQAGERLHVAVQFVQPEELHAAPARAESHERLTGHFEETLRWWRDWSSKLAHPECAGAGIVRSAIVLKALTYAPTGAIIAAPTTSLPEAVGGKRNWDYRYSWIRDSVFTVHALSALGLEAEADGFRRFIQRSAAGNVEDLQVLYGVDGKRRMVEMELETLDGWRRSRPVRIGNGAARQYQADMFGLVLELQWRWSERGRSEAEHYWSFLRAIVEAAISQWHLPDRGIWEIRSRPRHFVHSKVMCWAAVNRGIALAERYSLPAPLDRWRAARGQIKAAVEARGMDSKGQHFVQSFGSEELDAALLLLPSVEFIPYRDERMVRTANAIQRSLRNRGLIMRYRTQDGLPRGEGVFLPCTFWLVECLAHQGRAAEARKLFARASGCANELGLFAEEYDGRSRQMLGNFPQGLTHLAHISAILALNGRAGGEMPTQPSARASRQSRRESPREPRAEARRSRRPGGGRSQRASGLLTPKKK
ncbi:MAG TPA: glycoside hydrolase family 15 protein [Steroidobacteraceae bacterium]|nr:glycoside hydrolase family 15 protein [Steroidobacteraceae bacterium]